MFSKTKIETSMKDICAKIQEADAIVIGAGAGLSTAAGYEYAGERFNRYFSDFEEKYDFYLSKESIFFDCRLHHLASYRIPHIVISKRVKKILEQFSVKQCWYWPVYFEELFNE